MTGMTSDKSSSRHKAVGPQKNKNPKLDPKVQARIDADLKAHREKLEQEAIAEAEAERKKAKPAEVVDLMQIKNTIDTLEALIAQGKRLPKNVEPSAVRGLVSRRSRAKSKRELPTQGEYNISEDYGGTALADIRALLELLGVVRIPDVIEANIYNHKGMPVTASNARRFLEKLEASGEAFCAKEPMRHIPGPGWRYVWASTPKLLVEALNGKHPRKGEGRDGVNKA